VCVWGGGGWSGAFSPMMQQSDNGVPADHIPEGPAVHGWWEAVIDLKSILLDYRCTGGLIHITVVHLKSSLSVYPSPL